MAAQRECPQTYPLVTRLLALEAKADRAALVGLAHTATDRFSPLD